jgi:tripartite-type tricarboxylate transporter receptor subunit TctC
LILVITGERDVSTWDELIDSSESGETFTTAQIGIGLGLYYDLIDQRTAANFEAVTGYEGTGPVIGDLKRGDVDLFIGPAASLFPFVEDGTVDPVLTNDSEVFPESLLNNYSDIGHDGIAESTFSEAGLDEVATLVISARAIMAPPNVSDDRVQILQDAVFEASQSDEFKEKANEANIPVNPMTASDLQDLLTRKEQLLQDL